MSADYTAKEMSPPRPRPISTARVKIAGWRAIDPKAGVARGLGTRSDPFSTEKTEPSKGSMPNTVIESTGFAVSRLRDPVEAEDVVQDTFLEIHRCLASREARLDAVRALNACTSILGSGVFPFTARDL